MKRLAGIFLILLLLMVGCQSKEANQKPQTEKENATSKQEETMDEERETEEPVGEVEEETVSVWTTSNVNFRKAPDTSSDVIKVISRGEELQKIREENEWIYVKYGNDTGYVSGQYVSDSKPEEKVEETTQTEPKVEWIAGQHRDPNKIVVVIDPGHQLKGDSTKEPNGPGSSTMKARVTSGTTGVSTRVPEYVMNLALSLKLRTELENRGYTVYMTRTVHEVNISNMERAKYAESVNADIAVRIHGNGSENRSVHGAEAYVPSASNPYVSHLAKASNALGKCVIDAYCAATGFKNRGVFASDTMTGMNWSTVPVTIIEVGYMSNAEEDVKMQDETMQNNMVQGIANGIDKYFGF